jgi:hypothetical protein
LRIESKESAKENRRGEFEETPEREPRGRIQRDHRGKTPERDFGETSEEQLTEGY